MCPSVPPPPANRKKEPPRACVRACAPPMPAPVRVRLCVRVYRERVQRVPVMQAVRVRVSVRVCVRVPVGVCAGVACMRDGVGVSVPCVRV